MSAITPDITPCPVCRQPLPAPGATCPHCQVGPFSTRVIPPQVIRAGIPSRRACRKPPQSKSKKRRWLPLRIKPPTPFWSGRRG